MNSYLNLFGLKIPLYGVFFFSGIIIAVSLCFFLTKKRAIKSFDFAACAVYTMIGAIIGAKGLFIVVSIEEIIALDLSFVEVMRGGFVFYGGLIGGALGVFIYSKQFKLNPLHFFDCFSVVLPLGHAFGRVGCFFSGCCYGIPHEGFLSFVYETSSNYSTPIGVPLLAVQLIESFFLLVLFTILLTVFLKKKRVGSCAIIYMFGYSILRFVLEFFRGDGARGFLLNWSTSQWISIAIFIAATTICLQKKFNNR